ncbi:5-oxoprolinase subunit PxpB [Seonamhaeicola algicola]|uniref:5-oxoprolinase subunit PxpB n=1 Tax=Seonamhaeicola algicola TaxID=1719036 RepID=A0A5C7B3K5_9FLAO|nr:5-oxoprolinase subunit PxpB [Seonamhaeicola algicola]TXE15024.1 5-oxoprolinase subunit PxpB [Seonamhaeicola algicola]
MTYQLKYKPFGEQSVLIEWPQIISKEILKDVLSFKAKLEAEKRIHDVNHAYNSLLVSFNDFTNGLESKINELEAIYNTAHIVNKYAFKRWRIPVCYDTHFGIDLHELALTNNLSVDEVIRRHSTISYTVYFIGFLPGFLYLGGLDKTLYTPRKASPRLKIEKGAVAIGGGQTGIYPSESPGGWNIIGNSPINFFDIKAQTPCFANAGDEIQFYQVSKEIHSNIKTLVEAGVYQIESEVIND